jgi:prepilin-type N-terminal cleavage/methylation domain-containing protein
MHRPDTRLSDQSLFLVPGPRTEARGAQRGVTLIEMLVTVAMTAVALSISVPQFRRLRGPYQVTAATHQVVAAVESARFRAIARNTRYRVSFAQQGASYTIEREATPNTFVAEGGTQALPSGVQATAGTAPMFDTRGMVATPVTVALTATAIPTKTITINALGQATIE